jgi:hypothetical protein
MTLQPRNGKGKVPQMKTTDKPEAGKNVWCTSSPATAAKESIDAGTVEVENIKAYLGPPKYKQLKLLTRNFASNEIHSESFVDQALCLFDDGIRDEMFWHFLPDLIRSVPNEQNSRKALQYLDGLRQAYGLNNR